MGSLERNVEMETELRRRTFVCTICGNNFVSKSSINRHMRKIHKAVIQSSKVPHMQCPEPMCGEKTITYLELDEHLSSKHEKEIIQEEYLFSSMDDFQKWKDEFEKKTISSFVLHTSTKTDQKQYKQYICHRSGNYKEKLKCAERQRNIKRKGSNKINSTCPARIKITINKKGEVKAFCVTSHIGHDTEVGRLRLTQAERLDIAEKLFQGINNYRILKDLGDKFNADRRIRYTTVHDLHNIKHAFKINSDLIFHNEDLKSVNILIEKLKSNLSNNPILLYKPIGEEHPKIGTDNFFLIFMNKAQEEMLKNHGNDILMIDSTHGTNPYKIQLTTLMIVDENYEGFPVAFLWSIKQTEEIYKHFFFVLKEKVPNLKTKVFMSDDSITFFKAFVSVFDHTPKKLLCDWHVKKNLKDNLTKIIDVQKRNVIKKEVLLLINELEEQIFEPKLHEFIANLNSDISTQPYGEYFSKYYANRTEQWAHCFRRDLHQNTNMCLEKWHQKLKYNAEKGGRCQQRLDISIHNVLERLRLKFFRCLVSIKRNRVTYKLAELLKRHKISILVKDESQVFLEVPNKKWVVGSSKNNADSALWDFYEVTLVNNEALCTCILICNECDACIHKYSCTCHDYSIQFNMCKHIHLIALKNRTQKITSTTKNDAEVEVPHELPIAEVEVPYELSIAEVEVPHELSIAEVEVPHELPIAEVEVPHELPIVIEHLTENAKSRGIQKEEVIEGLNTLIGIVSDLPMEEQETILHIKKGVDTLISTTKSLCLSVTSRPGSGRGIRRTAHVRKT